jgi:hypothetical protein
MVWMARRSKNDELTNDREKGAEEAAEEEDAIKSLGKQLERPLMDSRGSSGSP